MSEHTYLSQWFDGSLHRPWEPGVYQRQIGRATMYGRWDGKQWYAARNTAKAAWSVPIVSYTQVASWRGLAGPVPPVPSLPAGLSIGFARGHGFDDGDGY